MSSEEEKCQNFGRCLGGSLISVGGSFVIFPTLLTRHFTCTCVRCCDPTEMGTMLRYWWIQQFFFTISDTKSKANTNQIMHSAVRCRLPECGGFVLQRKDEGFTFFVIIMTWPITNTTTTIRTSTTKATRCWRLLGMWGLQIGAKSLNDACTCHHDPGPGVHLHLVQLHSESYQLCACRWVSLESVCRR